ncbi:hypothetical protein [Streptomyces pinistramenti]|uniref:hypothetical protein n=1 Tax=Streptomyces pinistramenti TaxID=2884812 RepID=UPI001D06CBC9|nr:hypothetical protein [Streptomyces pinistramenti]MCB5907119.1 hypothetical protein [Streptomyces pinistramenti]
MTEWINPRYAALVQSWRDTQEQRQEVAPIEGTIFAGRGFIAPDARPNSDTGKGPPL